MVTARAARSEFFPSIASQGQQKVEAWLPERETKWVTVMEARPEVTVRLDAESSASWLRGKRVLILGAGALGAPIAEACVWADAVLVKIIDEGQVSPGILSRQPHYDFDIGKPKALALAARWQARRQLGRRTRRERKVGLAEHRFSPLRTPQDGQ
jgi:hypothetical protein